ncbi:urease accessory protein UreE [Helicobacter mehlei]|uniref:Urease accessory protein UreE n=1 Tax=Helicobacter mehlei TaxID=2316080 RepID=A0A553UKY9_9HELI|nr:urease accessory protein UreE [Helicobacter mehlei]TSA80868.1 urease accessory protein UreE [Helicobacter mehlei]
MRIESILGNLKEGGSSKELDFIDLEWFDAQKRMGRFTSQKGAELVLKLKNPPKMGLCDGDILFEDATSLIAINIIPTPTLHVYTDSTAQVARLCYEVGNRHASLYYGDSPLSFKTPFERPLQVLFDKLALRYEVLKSKLDASQRISVSAPHADPLQEGGAPLKFKSAPDLQIVMKK